jgi:hypothetical protein
MTSIRGHFDGTAVVLDEPAALVVGQPVRVIVEADNVFSPWTAGIAALCDDGAWDESVVLHIDPLDAVPADFVRRPGSAAGKIMMADDFAATPDEFKDYL